MAIAIHCNSGMPGLPVSQNASHNANHVQQRVLAGWAKARKTAENREWHGP